MLTPNPAHNGVAPDSRLLQGHHVLDPDQRLDEAVETCLWLELWLDLVDPASPYWCATEARAHAAGGNN
jgi:hypothetical protein